MAPGYQLLHPRFITAGNHLYPSVWQVSYLTCNAQFIRLLLCANTKKYTLNLPLNYYSFTNHSY
jgi:hypothetical protein